MGSVLQLLIAMFFASLCFLLVILLLKVAPEHSAEMLSIVSKCSEVPYGENMCVR